MILQSMSARHPENFILSPTHQLSRDGALRSLYTAIYLEYLGCLGVIKCHKIGTLDAHLFLKTLNKNYKIYIYLLFDLKRVNLMHV